MKAIRARRLIGLVLAGALLLIGQAIAFDDPTTAFVGAPSMGMGKIGLTYIYPNVTAVFTNPALLAQSDGWQLTSMNSRFLGEFDVFQIGGSTPFLGGTLGLSVVQLSSSGLDYVLGYDILTGNPQLARVDYYNRVIKPTYAQKVNIKYLGEVNLGLALKIFQQGVSSYSDSGSGMDLDIGLSGNLSRDWRWGLLASNILPSSSGGKNVWKTAAGNREESIPAALKMALGSSFFQNRLNWEMVLERSLQADNKPWLWHLGGEYMLRDNVRLRAGIDQEPVPGSNGSGASAINDLTAGLGVSFGDFSFDYAYHTYNDIAQNTSHFFSLSYKGPGQKSLVSILPDLILDPAVAYSVPKGTLALKGNTSGSGTQVYLNGKLISVSGATFESSAQISSALNEVNLKAVSPVRGSISVTKTISPVQLFRDVPPNQWAYDAIMLMAANNIMRGNLTEQFRPNGYMGKTEFIATASKLLPPADAQKYVDRYKRSMKGKKDAAVTRGECMKILAELDASLTPKGTGESVSRFSDMKNHWAGKAVAAAEKLGWFDFIKNNPTFGPGKKITRAGIAQILSRTALGRTGKPLTVIELRFNDPATSLTVGLFDKETKNLKKETYSAKYDGKNISLTVPRLAEDPDIRILTSPGNWSKDKSIRLISISKDQAVYEIASRPAAISENRVVQGLAMLSLLLLGLAAFDGALRIYSLTKKREKKRIG